MQNIWTITDKHCEIRFKSSSNFLKEKQKLHESLIKHFPIISEPNVTTYVYQNPDAGFTFSVTNTNCVLTGQLNVDESKHKTMIKELWPIVKRILNVNGIQRIGLREMCLIQNDDPQSLSVQLNTKFIGIAKANFIEYHLNYTKLKESKGQRIATSNHIYQNIDAKNPNNSLQLRGLLYDIDVFENNILPSKDISGINDLYNDIREIRDKISEPNK